MEDAGKEIEKKIEERRKVQLHCNFCGKEQFKVKKLIAGPESHICNDCVDLCYKICREKPNGSLDLDAIKREANYAQKNNAQFLIDPSMVLEMIQWVCIADKLVAAAKPLINCAADDVVRIEKQIEKVIEEYEEAR